jgi:glycosyltransferase involved in cell wall biosynthesis
LKILLSAFACEPNHGSEPGLGWDWAMFLAQAGHRVVVLTRSQSRPTIERVMKGADPDAHLRFEYFDVPKPLRWQMRGPLHLHNFLWQWLAADFAKELHRREQFDCVHHVTLAGLRAPSFMGKLGIPFIFGPVGGGECAPWRLRLGYSWLGFISDAARDAANLMIPFTPFMNGTFASAERIYVTSRETLRLMPGRFRNKAQIELAIGTGESALRVGRILPPRTRQDACFRILYAGRFIDCKGMHLGLPAFARLIDVDPGARLTMVGHGPVERRWRKLAEDLGIAGNVEWLPWQDRETMANLYADHDVLLFPALHDSGGMVVLEAMNQGLPVVCLKLGGPATLVNERCGYAVDPAGKDVTQVVWELGDALIELARESTRRPLAQAARMRCRDFSWREKVVRIYGAAS